MKVWQWLQVSGFTKLDDRVKYQHDSLKLPYKTQDVYDGSVLLTFGYIRVCNIINIIIGKLFGNNSTHGPCGF